MDDAQRKIEQDQQSVYVEKGNVTVNYASGKKIPKHLGTLPIIPDVFLGHEADLTIVHDKLFAGNNLLLLVNGEGGIGKTTFASRYYHQYANEYTHVGWVFAEKSISDAMLTLANALQLTFDEQMKAEERLQELLRAMAELKKPCLLVIDNANTLADLEAHYHALHSCSNFHLLLTTRITEFAHAEPYPINALDEKSAIQLFSKHYEGHNAAENDLLKEILKAVGYNTLVIELLAKNLHALNLNRQRYTLRSLLTDLQSKGLFALSQSTAVSTTYKSKSLRKEKPEAILAAMYNLGELDEEEKALLSVFAVLPAEPIAFDVLDELLPDMESFENQLTTLATKGWLDYNAGSKSYKCSPVVQEIIRQQNKEMLFEHCEPLIDSLTYKLEYEPGIGHLSNTTYSIGSLLTRYAENLIINTAQSQHHKFIIPLLLDRVGNFHKTTGNLEKALTYFTKRSQYNEARYTTYPYITEFKYSLAISYEKLGQTYLELHNYDNALAAFQKQNNYMKELYEESLENFDAKHGLAISYAKLGQTYTNLGNNKQALICFEKYSSLIKELCKVDPKNFDFKHSLAIAYAKLGQTHVDVGNINNAMSYFEMQTKIFEELYNEYPQKAFLKYGIANSHNKTGKTHLKLGNIGNALTCFDAQLQISQKLYNEYPQNINFKLGLEDCYGMIGETYLRLGIIRDALVFFEKQKHIIEELYTEYPRDIRFKSQLASSYERIGQAHFDLNNFATALIFFETQKNLIKKLSMDSPSDIYFKANTANSFTQLGKTHAELGNIDEALTCFEAQLQISQELYNEYPQNIDFKFGLSLSYGKFGYFNRYMQQDFIAAYNNFQRAKVLLEELLTDYPTHAQFQDEWSWVHQNLDELSNHQNLAWGFKIT